ncbi:MAG TPA: hypothetical protein VH815_09925, partial [Acidobacteriota bacterium]
MYYPIKSGFLRSFNFSNLFLFVLLLVSSHISAQEPPTKQPSPLYDLISHAIQGQNLSEFLSLASDHPEERKDLQTFFEEFQNFKATRIVIKLAEEKDDLIVLHVLLQRGDES